jgi:hypothetical protein
LLGDVVSSCIFVGTIGSHAYQELSTVRSFNGHVHASHHSLPTKMCLLSKANNYGETLE